MTDARNQLKTGAPAGYIPLTPRLEFSTVCPKCGTDVEAKSWKITGIWSVAEYECPGCGCLFFEDLPYSLGVVCPCWVDIRSGKATPRYSGQWYATLTENAWRQRDETPVTVNTVRSPRGGRACVVNCLYPWWGDAVSLLLRVNQLRSTPDMGIIVLINPELRWLVPDDVEGIWEVAQGFSANGRWREVIGKFVKAKAESLGIELFLPAIFESAYLNREEIHKACKIEPFPLHEWLDRLRERPTVTFMWRTDRLWPSVNNAGQSSKKNRLLRRLERRMAWLQKRHASYACKRQVRNVVALGEKLREAFPRLEFAVCGLDKEGRLPDWIKDLRVERLSAESNLLWSRQASQSHVVTGVLGSHMSVPGALSGSYVELVPPDMWSNILTCAPVSTRQPRGAIFLYRMLPAQVDPTSLADLITSILINYPYARMVFSDEHYRPLSMDQLASIRNELSRRSLVLSHASQDVQTRIAN